MEKDPPVHPVTEFNVAVFRTVDRWHHGVMLTVRVEDRSSIWLTFTPELAQSLKEELEKVLPFMNRRDA